MFVDYNQNARDRTVASCYSVRPTPTRGSRARSLDEVPDVEPGDLRLDTVPSRLRTVGDPAADIDEDPGSLEQLLDLARRDEEGGLGDAPWPPHFPKRGTSRSACSRAATGTGPNSAAAPATPSPAARPRACSTAVGVQQGFGAKPRTGQGHEHEFEECRRGRVTALDGGHARLRFAG